jgi:hypothetical protein
MLYNLASHCVSIALAQAKHAAEAQITHPLTDITVYHPPEQQDEDQSEAP